MKFEMEGFRKFGMAGVTTWGLLAFIVFDVVTVSNERLLCIGGAIGITVLYIIGNIVQKKLLNNGGNNNEEVPNGDDPRGPTV